MQRSHARARFPAGSRKTTWCRLREAERWFVPASEAFEAIQAGQRTDADWEAITPLTYGRWDAAAQAHHAGKVMQRNPEAAAFAAEGAFDPPVTRAALATFRAQVRLVAGELDVAAPPSAVAELAGCLPNATFAIQPGAAASPGSTTPSGS